MTRVSVIIPAYQAGHMIGKALQSLKEQSMPEWELIVIDDASRDNTGDVLRAFSSASANKITYVRNTENQGIAACRNTGLQKASGQFIAFLDADDFWKKEHLEKGLETLERGSDLCYSGFHIFDRDNDRIIDIFSPDAAIIQDPLIQLFKRSFIQTSSSVMISGKLAEAVGKFDEKLPIGEDRDYWLRAVLKGFKMRYTGYVTCYYSKHGQNMMLKTMTVSEYAIEFYKKHLYDRLLPLCLRRKLYANSLFDHARLIMGEDPQMALEQYAKAWKTYPAALHYILWVIYGAFNLLINKER